jgi:hypothetical protein
MYSHVLAANDAYLSQKEIQKYTFKQNRNSMVGTFKVKQHN